MFILKETCIRIFCLIRKEGLVAGVHHGSCLDVRMSFVHLSAGT